MKFKIFRFSLKDKYKKAQKMCNQMAQYCPKLRPNCEQILEIKNSWALNENEFEINKLLSVALSPEKGNENFITYNIILSKFIDINHKEEKSRVRNYETKLEFILNLLESNKDKPEINQILFNALCDYTSEYCRIMKNLYEIKDFYDIKLESQSQKYIKSKWIEKDLEIELNFKLLQKVFDLIMRSMESHPNNQKIHSKLISLIFYGLDFRELIFNVNKCIHLAMNLLLNSKDDDFNRISVEICYKLISKTSISEGSQLFSNSIYIEKLIEIVKNSIHDSKHDIFIIENITGLLWNVTNLSPNICDIFVEKGGIDLYLDILNVSLLDLTKFKRKFCSSHFYLMI
jgi:hypothetical protein